MIVAEDKKIKKCPVSLQPDIENLLQDLSPGPTGPMVPAAFRSDQSYPG